MTSPEQSGQTPGFGAFPFPILLIILELLMYREFSCPCTPGLNVILMSFLFLGPALLALTFMMFFRRPCRRKSRNFAQLLSFSLIPPALWMFLLLFEGNYVACAVAHWEGDYVLDEDLRIKWCKPNGINGTDLLELTEKAIFYSRLLSLALLLLVCVAIMTAIIYSDCKNRSLEEIEKRDAATGQTSLNGSKVREEQQP